MGQHVEIVAKRIGDTDIIARAFPGPRATRGCSCQGRLSLSTDGDKCAMVIFLGG